MYPFCRQQKINSQAIRDLAQVNAVCNELNDDKTALLLEMKCLKTGMKAEINLKDKIINDYETVILELSNHISHFSRRNSKNNSG